MSSQKINSKNLTYDSTLPPFLRALHAQTSGSDAPDPILAGRRRPRGQARSASEEAEDAPLVLDEDGNVVADLTVDDDGGIVDTGAEKNGGGGQGAAKEEDGKPSEAQTQKVATFGAVGRKRKAGKVVGNDDGADKDAPERKISQKGGDEKDGKGPTQPDKESGTGKPKPKKKAKKIKLSFDEEGE